MDYHYTVSTENVGRLRFFLQMKVGYASCKKFGYHMRHIFWISYELHEK